MNCPACNTEMSVQSDGQSSLVQVEVFGCEACQKVVIVISNHEEPDGDADEFGVVHECLEDGTKALQAEPPEVLLRLPVQKVLEEIDAFVADEGLATQLFEGATGAPEKHHFKCMYWAFVLGVGWRGKSGVSF